MNVRASRHQYQDAADALLHSKESRVRYIENLAPYCVMYCVPIDGLEAYAYDVNIPLKYRFDQCVGDTICAGGIVYGQRTIPAMVDFCKDMREVAHQDLLHLNYANPMALNTWACLDHG